MVSKTDMVLALMELVIWQERHTSKSHYMFKACSRHVMGKRRERLSRRSDIWAET